MNPPSEDLRDPIDVLRRAQEYIALTRGFERAKESKAWCVIEMAIKQIEESCIDSLLGPAARKNGAVCPCVRCQIKRAAEGEEKDSGFRIQDSGQEPEPRPSRNGKMAAAGDEEP